MRVKIFLMGNGLEVLPNISSPNLKEVVAKELFDDLELHMKRHLELLTDPKIDLD